VSGHGTVHRECEFPRFNFRPIFLNFLPAGLFGVTGNLARRMVCPPLFTRPDEWLLARLTPGGHAARWGRRKVQPIVG
jgi:hypothetical protein